MNNDCKVCGFPFDYQHTHETCVFKLNQEVERLQSLTLWVKYVEGDTSTYPQQDGELYQIKYMYKLKNEPIDRLGYGHEYYYFNDGWATNQIVLAYRSLPQEGVK